jgi:flavin reductase (DIM6/NTAB) family NADH-FMN oxidoreductase RutF
MHIECNLPILYFGTPVVLISTKNEDGTDNIAPFSSIFWLTSRCVIGISASSHTSVNLLREKECVLNLPSVKQVKAVNALAKTTGKRNLPQAKVEKGYVYNPDKFSLAGLTPVSSQYLKANRAAECPVQMEAKVKAVNSLGEDDPMLRGRILYIELDIIKIYADESILWPGTTNRIDPDRWKPLIMSFQEFYTTGEKAAYSRLAEIPEHLYALPITKPLPSSVAG